MDQRAELAKPNEYKTGGWSAHWILIVCTVLVILNQMDRAVLPAVLQSMKIDLGLTDAEAGGLTTAMTLSIAFFSYPLGFLMDRWSRKKSIAIMAVLWSAFTFITGMARSFIGAVIPRVLVGVGEASYIPGGTSLVAAAYSKEKRARMMSVYTLGVVLGLALGIALGGAVCARMGWRWAFFVFAVPGIIFGLLALTMKDYKTVATFDVRGRKEGIFQATRKLLRIRTLPWFWLAYALSLFMWQGTLTWANAYLMRSLGIREDAAGSIMASIMLAAIIGIPLGGWLADLWQKKRNNGRALFPAVSYGSSALLAAINIFAITTGSIPLIMATGILYSMVLNMGTPSLFSVGQDVAPPAYKVLVGSLGTFSAYVFGGSWSPWAIGAISDALGGGEYGLRIALYGCSAVGFAATVLFLISAKHYAADAHRVKDMVLEAEG